MTKALAVLAAVAFGLSLSMSAGAADKTLAEIHGSAWPKSVNGYVVKEQCKACHGDYSKLAKMTENLDPNPHHSHLGDVNCTDCHKSATSATSSRSVKRRLLPSNHWLK